MKKLTAESARTDIANLHGFLNNPRIGLSLREERYLQALEIALPVLEQQEKGADGWIEWRGGECPIAHPRQEVEYLTRLGNEHITPAGDLRWYHEGKGGDIIAYRVVEQERERGEEE